MNKTKVSKTVSYILRHHPEDFDLKLAADASVEINELLEALRRNLKISLRLI
jgi:putative RNA 2'-phosphotransferase